jgi:diaminopimelate epimerase
MLLSKHHGLGNDFLVALDVRNERALPVDAELARHLCDRRRGIGADGLIHGAEPDADQRRAGIDVVMHLFNSDGSRAEISGNGIRCLGQALTLAQGMADGGTVEVLTDAGRRRLEIGPSDAAACQVSVSMGIATAGPHVPDPLAESLPERFGTADLGNPHLVLLVDDPAGVDLVTEGAWLEQQFPDGVNVEYIRVTEADGSSPAIIDLRVWERGAGITEACGSGACAAAFVARSWGLVGEHALVRMPGGEAEVRIAADDAVTLVGPSVYVADVVVPDTVAVAGDASQSAPDPSAEAEGV